MTVTARELGPPSAESFGSPGTAVEAMAHPTAERGPWVLAVRDRARPPAKPQGTAAPDLAVPAAVSAAGGTGVAGSGLTLGG